MKKFQESAGKLFSFFWTLGRKAEVIILSSLSPPVYLRPSLPLFLYLCNIYLFLLSPLSVPINVTAINVFAMNSCIRCVDLSVYIAFLFMNCFLLWLGLPDLSNIWDILIFNKYSLFVRNSNLIRCPVFYLASLALDLFRSNHASISSCSCMEVHSNHPPQFIPAPQRWAPPYDKQTCGRNLCYSLSPWLLS